MRLSKRYGLLVAFVMIAAFVGVVFATVAESISDGMHQISLTSSTSYVDKGLGFFGLNTSDSIINTGLFFSNVDSGVLDDTTAAVAGNGTPKPLNGVVSGSAGTFYVQMSDTARTTISLSFSSATAATGSWSGQLTGGSGTAMDTFRSGSFFSSDSGTLRFGDSIASADYPASMSMRNNGDTASTTTDSHRVVITWDSLVAVGDAIRLITINSQGKIAGDSNMSRFTATDTTWISPVVRLETGVTEFVVIVWDASRAKYVFFTGRLALGVNYTAIPATGGWAQATNLGAISQVTVTAGLTTPQIRQIEIVDIANDATAKGDGLAVVDSNTSGFDTRLANTAFSINLFDANNNPITSLASGQTVLVVLNYNFVNLTAAQVSSIRLLHRNSGTNAWEVVSNSSAGSTNGRLVAYVSNFSDFAMGNVSSSSSSAAPNDNNCVINNALGNTSLAGIMPSLRGVRDVMMGNALGRLFVSGYYGLAALGLLFFAATGAGYAFSKRS